MQGGKPQKCHNFTGKNMRSGSILKVINIWAALWMQGETESSGWPPHLHLSSSVFFSFPLLVFQASETPPCVRLHSVPWAAQAWRSVLKVSGRPCPVADIGYKLPARPSEKPWRMSCLHFYSNPTKVWLRSRSPSVASLIPSWLPAPAVLIGADLSVVLK